MINDKDTSYEPIYIVTNAYLFLYVLVNIKITDSSVGLGSNDSKPSTYIQQ